MLASLKELHELGLIHLDVKPDNFRISKDHVVKILDLGLMMDYIDSKGHHKRFGSFGFSGTPYYASINAL